ncbi:MAG: HAD-IIB family hydrolase [Gomphosphaeria aponina SAG 52.96 = DSM 107014]|uniref:sucrose-phosphate synthase n=1 Tax=Gomphosphaeria aponina SAG 52.96 = DSM 107014 TaxID=1521640 RepID=A0A941GWF9_9CHRO|nr:HAD-IIB family hydrolase [Gomphosphaeria aponina SAG 52.96 = DSM 107014]
MKTNLKYILLISIHGLIRGQELELGRDADTGGQTKYVLELAQALSKHPEIQQVDLMTKLLVDPQISPEYSQPIEPLNQKANIIRISCGKDEYIPKEELWDYLDNFADNAIEYLQNQEKLPDVIHSHYADAGYVGVRLSHQLEIPLIHTGHSLGRSKRKRLLASGITREIIEKRYNMIRRINAEEETLSSAERVITSTTQEINEQYGQYDYYEPQQMRVIPPGTDVEKFYPPVGSEWESNVFKTLAKFLNQPQKPIILALSRLDQRKNIRTLIEAFGECKDLQERANLVIVAGIRNDIQDLENSVQEVFTDLLLTIDHYDLYGKVAYPKAIPSEDIGILYRLAAISGGVFVNPALTEPFGLTLIEAAASGLPIVATKDGGPVDIIKNCQNGYLIDPLDPQNIADTLLKVLEEQENWQILAQNGLAKVKEHYTWESHVEIYVKMLQQLIDKTEKIQKMPLQRRPMMYHNGAIVSSIDQNLLGHRNSLTELMRILNEKRKTISFCIATGRSLDSALKVLQKHNIIQPDILITSMGTEIYYSPDLTRDDAWTNHINYLWNRQRVVSLLRELPGLTLQPKEQQRTYKISYYYDPLFAHSVEEIKRLLLQNEQTVNVIFSFGQFLDIVPVRASKGYAVRWFAQQWDIPLTRILTAGGSGGDEDMMLGNTLSVVVANRHTEELLKRAESEPIYFSEKQFAAGIIDGLNHYDFFSLCEQV